MRLGINLGYWQRDPEDDTETVLAAERLGYDFVFTAEAHGSDAFTTLTWYGARTSRIGPGTAVTQISARTPAATAMHALTLDGLWRDSPVTTLLIAGVKDEPTLRAIRDFVRE